MKTRAELRKATNVTVADGLIQEARRLKINLSQAAEAGIARAVAAERARLWQLENHGILEKWNDWAGKHGLPLEKYRMF
jgi:antitoxin CcdA